MITRSIGAGRCRWLLEKIGDAIAATGVNPNVLTSFGLIVNFWAAVRLREGHVLPRRGGYFSAAFLDMLDDKGAARKNGSPHLARFSTPRWIAISTWRFIWGLLVFYAVNERASYVILGCGSYGWLSDGELFSRTGRIPDSHMP